MTAQSSVYCHSVNWVHVQNINGIETTDSLFKSPDSKSSIRPFFEHLNTESFSVNVFQIKIFVLSQNWPFVESHLLDIQWICEDLSSMD